MTRFHSSEAYKKWVRSLPCCLTGKKAVCAHIRKGAHAGVGQKPSDVRIVPLNQFDHDKQHRVGELTFWGDRLDEAVQLAQDLRDVYPSSVEANKLLFRFRFGGVI